MIKNRFTEEIPQKTWEDWKVGKVREVKGFYKNEIVSSSTITSLMDLIDLKSNNFLIDFDYVENEIKLGIRSMLLKDVNYWCTHLGHNNKGNRVDLCARVKNFAEVKRYENGSAFTDIYFYLNEQGSDEMYDFGFIASVEAYANPYTDFVLSESRKKVYEQILQETQG